MSYVPIVPPAARTRMSPRARELATQIEKTIREFQRNYPDTPQREVQEALTVLSGDSRQAPAAKRLVAAAVAAGIALLVGIVVFLSDSGGGGISLPSDATLWISSAVLVLVAVVGLAARRR